MANYDSIDLAWSWDGDIAVDDLGDIKDTDTNHLTALADTIQSIIKSDTLEWQKDPLLGANLSDFQGEPNDREVGKAIEDRIKTAISSQGIVERGDLMVRVIPVHNNQIMISLAVNAEPTIKNQLSPSEPLQISLVYDTIENSTFFLVENNLQRNGR